MNEKIIDYKQTEEHLKKIKKNNKVLIIINIILTLILALEIFFTINISGESDCGGGEMLQDEIWAFNSKFVSTEGKNVAGRNVKTLLADVITSNSNNDDSRQIYVVVDDTIQAEGLPLLNNNGTNNSSYISSIRNAINTSHRYTVELHYASNGIVDKIMIKDNNGVSKNKTDMNNINS